MVKKYTDIPNEPYNKNFQVMYYSVERGIQDWYYNFYGGYHNGVKEEKRYNHLKKKWDENKDNYHWYATTKFFLNLMTTIILEDTAYREMINAILLRLQKEMNYAWNPEIQHKIPMYMNMYDQFMPFFIEWKKVAGGGTVILDVKKAEFKMDYKNDNKKKKSMMLDSQTVDKINSLKPKLKKQFMKDMNKFLYRLLYTEKEIKKVPVKG